LPPEYTGCDGVMVAEALLWDPRLFSNPPEPLLTGRVWDLRPPADRIAVGLAVEYLESGPPALLRYLFGYMELVIAGMQSL
jgi:tRNA-dihydrouridine synthase